MSLNKILHFIASKPVLWRGNELVILTYGLFVGTAYSTSGLAVLWYVAQHSPELIAQYARLQCYFALPGAILGARFCSWCLEDNFDPKKILRPGFWWHGGLAGLILSIAVGCSWYSLSPIPLADGLGLAMPVFEVFNRLGCLSYGCCWGGQVSRDDSLHVEFRNTDSCIHRKQNSLRNYKLYPVQFYASLMSLIQVGFIYTAYKSFRVIPVGGLFGLTMLLSAIVRLICERFRADFRGSGFLSCWAFAAYQAMFGVGCAVVLCALTSSQLIVTKYSNGMWIQPQSNTTTQLKDILRPELLVAFATAFTAYGVQSDWRKVV